MSPIAVAAVVAVATADAASGQWQQHDQGHWQLQRDHIEIGRKIGSGEFGDVCKGVMTGTGDNEGMKKVGDKWIWVAPEGSASNGA